MKTGHASRVSLPVAMLNHSDVEQLSARVQPLKSKLIVIDLRRTVQTTTAALASLILLRRKLISRGRDLLIFGLSGQAAWMYDVCRMGKLLPRRAARCAGANSNVDRRNAIETGSRESA